MSKAAHPQLDLADNCACGQCRMSATGRVASMFMCSCLDCQKATGTGHVTIALFPSASVTVSGPEKTFARPADSGATFTRHFCPNCGTPLYGESSRAPDIRIVPVGFFAGQNAWFEPNQLIFARTKQEWDLIADHLPRHLTYRQEPKP